MKQSAIIIVIIVIIILAFFVFRKDKTPEVTPTLPETPTEEIPVTETPTPDPQTGYSYTNEEFDFAVKLPGLVMMRRQSSDPIVKPTIFTFGVGDQSAVAEEERIPNTMAVYIWKNKAELDFLLYGLTPTKETVNGREFDRYRITEGETTVYRYVVTEGDITYDVGVSDPKNASKFFLN